MQRIENNQNQTQKSYQGVNKPYGSNNSLSLKSKLSTLQNKVNSLRQNGADSLSSNNSIQYLGNSKTVNKQSEQNNATFQQAINDAKNMRGDAKSNMNELFTSLENGGKPIVRVNNGDKGKSKNNFAVVNSIRGNSVELFHSSQEKPITMSLRQLYNAMNPKNESSST